MAGSSFGLGSFNGSFSGISQTLNDYATRSLAVTIENGSTKGSLSNITGLIDTWGKPIPYSWGNIRVGGAGIWGSPYYEEIRNFSTTTQYYREYYVKDGIPVNHNNISQREDIEQIVTNSDKVSYAIDLAYSFGFEGILTGERELVRLRMNGKIIYDKLTGYLEPGIGFSVRKGEDLNIDPIMAQYPDTGKYYYNGQTYVVFEKFKPEFWGNALPTSVDAEFVQNETAGNAETIIFPPKKSYDEGRMIFHSARRKVYYVDYLDDNTTPALHVFDLDTGERLEDIKLTGPAAQIVGEQYDSNWQGGGSAITGLFDVKIVCDDFRGNYVIDLRYGYCEKLNNEYGTSMFWYEGDQDSAVVFQSKALDVDPDWRRYSLSRSGETVTVSTSSAIMLNGFSVLSEPPGAFDGSGKGSVVGIRDRTQLKNHVVLWGSANGNTVNGIVLEHGGEDGWQCLSAVSFEQGAVLLLSKSNDLKLMKFDKLGVLEREAPVAVNPNGSYIYELKARYEGFMSRPSSRYIGTTNNFNNGVLWDLQNLRAIYFDVPRTVSGMPFDSGTNKLYYNLNNETSINHGLIGPEFSGARVNLFDFMRSLYVISNLYEPFQITQDGLINETILGAMIITNTNVDQIINSICTLYKINKIDTINGVHFFKNRTSSEGLNIALQLGISDLADDAEGGDESKVLKTSRANVNQTPTQIDLRFLDPNNEYKENSVSWRRTNAGITRGTVSSIALPIVMTQLEALKLVQSAIIEGETRVHSHEFRLPPRYAMQLLPGDIIQIDHGIYRETIQIINIDLNGDYSASCSGVTIVDENIVEIKTPVYEAPKPIDFSLTTPSIGYVIDSPILTPGDDKGNGFVIQYDAIGPNKNANYSGGYLGRKVAPDGSWESLPAIKSTVPLTHYRTTSRLSDKKWVVDSMGLGVTLISGKHPEPKSNNELQQNPSLNIAWYGKPGRWEIIQFEGFFQDHLVGIIRGCRGTEVFAGMHEVGDFVIMAVSGVLAEQRPIDKVDIDEVYRAVSIGIPFGSVENMPTYKLKGLSSYPFAPSNIEWTKETNGDIIIKWMRRDRLSTGWGKEFAPTDLRQYRIGIYNVSGTSELRFYEVSDAEALTYTLADQNTDGLSMAETLNLKIAQKGQLGYGFAKVETI